jgi:hypothetical protein
MACASLRDSFELYWLIPSFLLLLSLALNGAIIAGGYFASRWLYAGLLLGIFPLYLWGQVLWQHAVCP